MAKHACRDCKKCTESTLTKFPASSAATVNIDGNEVTVFRDYVDAPNAYGTPVRTNFRCEEFHADPGTDMHGSVDFQVLDQRIDAPPSGAGRTQKPYG